MIIRDHDRDLKLVGYTRGQYCTFPYQINCNTYFIVLGLIKNYYQESTNISFQKFAINC